MKRIWLAAACGLLPAIAAHAEKADRQKPTQLEGAQCISEELKQVSICRGKVVLTRGTLRITGERMEVRQDPEGFLSAVVLGDGPQLASYRQRRDPLKAGVEEFVEGYAERIEYDERSDNVKFIQRARWRRLENDLPRDEVSGTLITYDNRSATYNVEGGRRGGDDERVRMILAPRDGAAGSAPPAPASQAAPVPLRNDTAPATPPGSSNATGK
jgi:lipopolysaccharide export system protein LptA